MKRVTETTVRSTSDLWIGLSGPSADLCGLPRGERSGHDSRGRDEHHPQPKGVPSNEKPPDVFWAGS